MENKINNYIMEIGFVLKNKAEELDITRAELARVTNRNPNTISNCFNGKNPNIATVIAICLAINMSLTDLFKEVENMSKEISSLPVVDEDTVDINTNDIDQPAYAEEADDLSEYLPV